MDAPTVSPPRKRTKMVLADLFILPVELQLDILLSALLPDYEPLQMPGEAQGQAYSQARMRNAIQQAKLMHRRYEAFAGDLRLRGIVRSKRFRRSLYRLWLSRATPALWARGYDHRTGLSYDVVRYARDLPDDREFWVKGQPGMLRDSWFTTYVADTYANDHYRWILMSAWRAVLHRQPLEELPLEMRKLAPELDTTKPGSFNLVQDHDSYRKMREEAVSDLFVVRAEADRVLAPGVHDVANRGVVSLSIFDLKTDTRPKGMREDDVFSHTHYPGAKEMRFVRGAAERIRRRRRQGADIAEAQVEVVATYNFVKALARGSVIRQPTLWWFDGLYEASFATEGEGWAFLAIKVNKNAKRRHIVFDAATPAVSVKVERGLEVETKRSMRNLRKELVQLTPGAPYWESTIFGTVMTTPGSWDILYTSSTTPTYAQSALILNNVRLMNARNTNLWLTRSLETSDIMSGGGVAHLRLEWNSVSFPKGDAFDPPRVLMTPKQWEGYQKEKQLHTFLTGGARWYDDLRRRRRMGQSLRRTQEIMMVANHEKNALEKEAEGKGKTAPPMQLLEIWTESEDGPPRYVSPYPPPREQ